MAHPMELEREWLASIRTFPLSSDELAGDASSYGVGKSLGGEVIRAPYLHSYASSSASRLSGKRSRSNSPLSFSDSPPSDDGGSSHWSSSSSQLSTQATSTPPSPPSSSQESDSERGCPSPTAAKRKATRCRRQETACAASVRRQLDRLDVDGASLPPPQPSSSSSSASSSFPQSDAELSSLDGAVQACGLDSRENTPERPVISQIDQPPSTIPGGKSANGNRSAAEGEAGRPDGIKEAMVDHLVGVALQTIHALWYQPLSLSEAKTPCTAAGGLTLHLFVRETLRRSRTSCSTLQAALLYCLRCGPAIRKRQAVVVEEAHQLGVSPAELVSRGNYPLHPLLCSRRIFLASIMVAAKFLQDKTFSNRAWSKITGLPVKELANVEREFLAGIQWDLNVKDDEWKAWTARLASAKATKTSVLGSSSSSSSHVATPAATAPFPLGACKASAFASGSSSRSSTPTPAAAHLTPKLGRSLLARSHSNDVAGLQVHDSFAAASAPPAMSAAHPLSRSIYVSESQGQDGALAPTGTSDISSASHGERDEGHEQEQEPTPAPAKAQAQPGPAPPVMAATTMTRSGPPAPYPMHRNFVRNAASFSARPAVAQ